MIDYFIEYIKSVHDVDNIMYIYITNFAHFISMSFCASCVELIYY